MNTTAMDGGSAGFAGAKTGLPWLDAGIHASDGPAKGAGRSAQCHSNL